MSHWGPTLAGNWVLGIVAVAGPAFGFVMGPTEDDIGSTYIGCIVGPEEVLPNAVVCFVYEPTMDEMPEVGVCISPGREPVE